MDPPASTSLPRAPKRSAPTSSSTAGTSSTANSSPSAAKRSRTVHFAAADHDDIGPQLPTSRTHARDSMAVDPTVAADSDDDRELPTDPRWVEAQARARAQTEARNGQDQDDEDEDEDEDEDPELHMLGGTRRGARKRDRFEGDRLGDEDSEDDDEEDDDDMFGEGGGSKEKKGKVKRAIQPMSYEDRKAQFMGKVGQFMDADDDNGGIELEPFNMRDEMRQGGFDESGTFIRKQDTNARYDNWLAGLTDADMESAAMAQEAREQERQAHERAVESRIARFGSQPHQLIMALCGLLMPRETPTTCLGRLNAGIERGPPKRGKGKQTKKSKSGRASAEGEAEIEWREPLASQWARQDVALVTDLADHLLNVCGMADIYETDREELVADLRDDGHVPRQWAGTHPLAGERKVAWAYTWIPAGGAPTGVEEGGAGAGAAQETHGPFEAHEMKGWADQGFFVNGIEVQRFVNGVPVGSKVVVSGDDASDFKWEAPS